MNKYGPMINVTLLLTVFTAPVFEQNTFPSSGNVGIGTTTPNAPLEIKSNHSSLEGYRDTLYLDNPNTSGDISSSVVYGYGGGSRSWELGNDLPATGDQDFFLYDDVASAFRLYINSIGNVGIGTTTPGARLEVDGNVKLTSGSGASLTFADGTVQSTAYTGVTCGGDYAESIDAIGAKMDYGPAIFWSSIPRRPDASSSPRSTIPPS
jgi:hypothetical protein